MCNWSPRRWCKVCQRRPGLSATERKDLWLKNFFSLLNLVSENINTEANTEVVTWMELCWKVKNPPSMITWWKQSFSLGLTRTRTAQMFPENQNVDCGDVVLCGVVVVIITTTTTQQLRDEKCGNCLPMIPMRPITETRMPSQVYLYHSTTLQYKTIIMRYGFIVIRCIGDF